MLTFAIKFVRHLKFGLQLLRLYIYIYFLFTINRIHIYLKKHETYVCFTHPRGAQKPS